jgi:hypothetical protein
VAELGRDELNALDEAPTGDEMGGEGAVFKLPDPCGVVALALDVPDPGVDVC